MDVQQFSEQIRQKLGFINQIGEEVGRVVVGQRILIERLIQGLLCDGHVLLEGLPGLAKTLTIKTLAEALDVKFQRVQFTPDLLPSDLVGTLVFNPKSGEFAPKLGPIFTNLVLADEINRAPAKVQSALLEAMGERQVTVGEKTYPMEKVFSVLATQNPIEQEGTYPLPEAQLDRFLFKVRLTYPSQAEERVVLDRMTGLEVPKARRICGAAEILLARQMCTQIYMDDKVKEYILRLVFATRNPEAVGLTELKNKIEVGASPRATLSLAKASRAQALLRGRGYVTPDDIKSVALDVMRHRVILTYEGEAEGWDSDRVVRRVLEHTQVP